MKKHLHPWPSYGGSFRRFLGFGTLALSIYLPTISCLAEKVVPSEKAIPPAKTFGETCQYDEPLMDDLTIEFVKGKPFKYDKFPYTAALTFEKPQFAIDVYYWETAEAAKKSFLEGKESVAKEPYCSVDALKKDDETEYFEFNFGGRVHCCSVIVHNVHFVLKDQYQQLGKEKMMEMTRLYAAFLKSSLPAKAAPSKVVRAWKNAAGKEIRGTLNGFDSAKETVDFTREDGKRFANMPITTFSQEDQLYIREQTAP